MMYNQTESGEIQYVVLQTESSNISVCRQDGRGNEISTAKPMFSRSSYPMGLVMLMNQTESGKFKMTASKFQL